MDVGVQITDPSGVVLTYPYSNLQPVSAGGSVTLQLPITVWASREYTVEVVAYFPPTQFSAVGLTSTASGQESGSDLHAGIMNTHLLPAFATSAKVTVHATNPSGSALANTVVQLSVIDTSTPSGTGAGGAVVGGSATTDANGDAVFEAAAFYLLTDSFLASWLIPNSSGGTAASGSVDLSAGELSAGAVVQAGESAPGGAPPGSSNSFQVQLTVDGASNAGVTIGAQLNVPGASGSAWNGSGITNSSGELGFAVPASVIALASSFDLVLAAQKKLGTGKGRTAFIEGSTSTTISASALEAGTTTVPLAAKVAE